jgi:hypothetical protein
VHARWTLIASFLLVAGCVDGAPTTGEAPPVSDRTTQGFGCPRGTEWRIAHDVCAAVLGGSRAELGEPVIALNGPDQIAIAALSNASYADDPLDALVPTVLPQGPQRTPCKGFGVCLFASRDGGATWTNASLAPLRHYYDPQIVFADNGRLVVAGLMFGGNGTTRIDVTSTTDDGATWAPSVTASTNERVDRPWLRAGTSEWVMLYVAETGREVRGGYSHDQGKTWSSGGTMTCRWPSPPIEVGPGTWMFLCSTYQDGQLRTQAVHWEPSRALLEPRGDMPGSRWFPILVGDQDGRLVALTSHQRSGEEASITLRQSGDQGATWSAPIDLRKASAALEDLRYSCLMAAHVDASGILRILVAGIPEISEQGQLCLPREARRHIYAIDVEFATGARIAIRPLGSPAIVPPVSSSNLPAINDDFHDIVDGAMAWSHDGVVAWTRLP